MIMPSIPQSLLWISLVVLWLFVLVPMLINKRDAVRRTSDAALATRVLTSGAAARLLKRGGPAAGHRSDPDWRPPREDEDEYDECDDLADDDPGGADSEDTPRSRGVAGMSAAASVQETGPDYVNVEVVDEDDEDSGALPVENSTVASSSGSADVLPEQTVDDEPADDEGGGVESDVEVFGEEQIPADEAGQNADHYECIDDTSGIAVAGESWTMGAPMVSRRRRSESSTAAVVSARKYAFRKRVLMTMALMLVGSVVAVFLRVPIAWWFCGSIAGLTVLYLGYLRRQTLIEERVHRRRMQRMARSRLGVENTTDREFDLVPARLRRPGAVVLEIDDEDPIFNHLDYAPYPRNYAWHRDLARAAGQ
jgi:hypothetical protein